MPDITILPDDLRAAVAAGRLTEAQAASLTALAQERLSVRQSMSADEEPFELFRGFAEVFISVGLVVLLVGVAGVSVVLQNPTMIFLACIAACVLLAMYFTRVRRMVLPSIVLVCGYAAAIAGLIGWFMVQRAGTRLMEGATLRPDQEMLMTLAAVGVGLLIWYRVFRVPFTVFLIGLVGLGIVIVISLRLTGLPFAEWQSLFNLQNGSGLAIGTLVFGILALIAGTWFDTRDPHRVGRASAAGFWLHLLAAPAIVNTLGQTAMNSDGTARYIYMVVSLVAITLLALVLDRRSFLTAAIGYFAWLIWMLTRQNGEGLDLPVVFILIGSAVTALGAGWTPMRSAVMRALPDFPGKDRLPPYRTA
ncbi:hypothetical protein [Paracoccus pacificus]|uniref:DUF2157 domain-containing protein n=1 Tax=Paracoccus pacificus TaxID=1463598 RepID=A0ABW4R2R2_9RHOB